MSTCCVCVYIVVGEPQCTVQWNVLKCTAVNHHCVTYVYRLRNIFVLLLHRYRQSLSQQRVLLHLTHAHMNHLDTETLLPKAREI